LHKDDHLAALQPGARLNNYTIVSVLGAGGFGITYKASEDITDRHVAIKEYIPAAYAVRDRDSDTVRPLSEGAAEDFAWGLDRFRQEAKLLIDLRHPNIVPVLAYFEANSTGYLVMEFQDGACLGDVLEARSVLTEAETKAMILPLLDGVEDVHRHDFLHRDIKPDNIFLRKDGGPVLLDFGAARQALGEHSKNLTTLLTEGYAPFEQYAGSGNQGPWSDVYALAAVMFRCIMGKAPIQAPGRAVARLRDLPDPLAPELAELRNRVSPDFALAIDAGLRVVEQERPQSIADFRNMIVALPPTARQSRATTQSQPGSTPTLVPDMALRAGLVAEREFRVAGRGGRRKAYAAVGALVVIAAGAAAYFGDHRSWLPEAFRRAGSDTGTATATTVPVPPAAKRPADGTRPPDDRDAAKKAAPATEEGLKGLAEHQRRQLDQVEAERRQWETQKSADAERKRLEEETAKKEADRKRRPEDADRQAEDERKRADDDRRARAEEARRARIEEDRQRQEEDRVRGRDAQEQPPRAAPGAPARTQPDRPRRTETWPPDMPSAPRAAPGTEAPPRLGGPGSRGTGDDY